MKQTLIHLNAVILTLFFFSFLPSGSLSAQTNFVKYIGNPVLPLGNPGEWDDAEAAYGHILFDGSEYQMWYSGAPEPQFYRIGYATSSDGLNWNKHAGNPVLGPGPSGGFDDGGAWLPMVLFDGSDYEMWYSGNIFIGAIGRATSADGISWSRHTGNPVLTASPSGSWNPERIFNPIVIRRDTLYQMWYSGPSASGIWQTGYATSPDGINWSQNSNNPVLTVGAPGEWDAVAAFAGSVLFVDGQYQMWYHGTTGNALTGIEIGYATSPDGVNWTKHSGNPILRRTPGNWDADNVSFARVIKDGHRYRMWYTGRASSGSAIDRLGYAEDFSNVAHVDSMLVNLETVLAGIDEITLNAFIANPRNENLSVRALIVKNDGSVCDSVDLSQVSDDRWFGYWAIPEGAHDYSVGVELNNISAGYIHNSFHWGVSDEFQSVSPSHIFTQITSIDDGNSGEANGLMVGSDGTIFLANGADGLRAYTLNGSSFTNIAHIDDGGSAMGVAEASDGTIFLANGHDGLRAYHFDGSSFSNLAHIENSDSGEANRMAIADDGTIFLANGADGLRAYTYDGASFTNTGHTYDCGMDDSPCSAEDVDVSADGTVFLANGRDGLRVYHFDGMTFINTAHSNDLNGIGSDANSVTVGADETIFVANGFNGLWAYDYNGNSLTEKSHIGISGGEASDLALASGDGTIFLAIKRNWLTGLDSRLMAFNFNGDSFTPTASIEAISALGVAIGADGTVFLANGTEGLDAYSYSGSITSVADAISDIPLDYKLLQNYPNPFNPSTTIEFVLAKSAPVTIQVFDISGKVVATLVDNEMLAPGSHQRIFDAGHLASGIYLYRMRAGNFEQTRKLTLLK